MFNRRLAELRKGKKLSQYKLAELMNLSRGQIANYEQGSREPDVDTLKGFADFFEVSMDCLLGYSSKSKQDQPKPQVFADNLELQEFYNELPTAKREAVKKLRDIWEIIKYD